MSESTAPVEQRDIRSAAKAFKRDRDSGEKWSMGTRPMPGVRVKYSATPGFEDIEAMGRDQALKEKVRPGKPLTYVSSQHASKGNANSCSHHIEKSHANKTPKPTLSAAPFDSVNHRMVRKVDAAQIDANEHMSSPLSNSLLELLPQHANNTTTSVQTAIRDQESGVLYSYDNSGASPGVKGRAVGLDSLVEMAEKKWVLEQTEKMVKGEYEVLDAQGETTVLSTKKGKKSPKQKAVKSMPAVVKNVEVEEDDEFELI